LMTILLAEMALHIHFLLRGLTQILNRQAERVWLRDHFKLFVMCVMASNSVSAAMQFVNCRLFGMTPFCMNVGHARLKEFRRLHLKRKAVISTLKLVIHSSAIWYIVEHNYMSTETTLVGFTILAAGFQFLLLLSACAESLFQLDAHSASAFSIRIEGQNATDVARLKKKRMLTRKMIAAVCTYIENAEPRMLEIALSVLVSKGIELKFVLSELVTVAGSTKISVSIARLNVSLEILQDNFFFLQDIRRIYGLKQTPRIHCLVATDCSEGEFAVSEHDTDSVSNVSEMMKMTTPTGKSGSRAKRSPFK